MRYKIKPQGYGNMFVAFDILHGVTDDAGTEWREFDIIARRAEARAMQDAAEAIRNRRVRAYLADLVAKLPEK